MLHRALWSGSPRHLRRAGLAVSVALAFGVCFIPEARAQSEVRFYPGEYYGGSSTPEGATPVVLQPGQESPQLRFTLAQSGGEIRGQLRGEIDGTLRPLGHVWVEAVTSTMRTGVFSAGNGTFRLTKIPAGRVQVRYSTDARGSNFPQFRAIWQGGSSDSAFALRLPVTDGGVLDLGAVRLPEGSLFSGEVLGDGQIPLAGVKVRILLQSIAHPLSWTAVSDRFGQWVQGGLSAGLYKVLALTDGSDYISEYLGDSRDPLHATVINLEDGQKLTGLELSPDPGAKIGGLLLLNGGSPAPGLEVEAIHSITRQIYRGVSNQLGIYEILGLPSGTYYVHVPAMYKYYPDSQNEHNANLVRVTEPNANLGIDVTGSTTRPCFLAEGAAGAIGGTVTAPFDELESATVVAYSDVDSLALTITGSGGYSLPCVPGGFYRVLLLPEGPYRTQYHPMVDSEEEAAVIHVIPPDSVLRVDFKPVRSVVLSGLVFEGATQGVSGIRIWAREDTSGVVVRTRTEAGGAFRIDRLPDGSGLPAGRWIVRAESTLIASEYPTPVMQPSLSADARAGVVEIAWSLAKGIDWSLTLDRVEENADVRLLTQDRIAGGSGAFLDRPPARGPYRYRLHVTPVDLPDGATYSAETGPIELISASRLVVRPNPAHGPIEFVWEGGPSPLSQDARLRIFTLDGRTIAAMNWPASVSSLAWDRKTSDGRSVASGRYFYRLESLDGRSVRHEGNVVVGR